MTEPAVTLAAQCTLRDASGLKATLAPFLETSEDVMLDGSAVQRIDTATLQVLLAFVLTRRTAGRGIQWRAPSASLLGAAARLGLGAPLRLPTPAQAPP